MKRSAALESGAAVSAFASASARLHEARHSQMRDDGMAYVGAGLGDIDDHEICNNTQPKIQDDMFVRLSTKDQSRKKGVEQAERLALTEALNPTGGAADEQSDKQKTKMLWALKIDLATCRRTFDSAASSFANDVDAEKSGRSEEFKKLKDSMEGDPEELETAFKDHVEFCVGSKAAIDAKVVQIKLKDPFTKDPESYRCKDMIEEHIKLVKAEYLAAKSSLLKHGRPVTEMLA